MCRRIRRWDSRPPKPPRRSAICSAPATGKLPARIITPDEVGQETRGKGTNTRFVRNILPDTGTAESLLVVEVITPGGNWSSYPPHKHDVNDPPRETLLEETYYHRLSPPQGFAFQRVYTDDRSLDETMAVSGRRRRAGAEAAITRSARRTATISIT